MNRQVPFFNCGIFLLVVILTQACGPEKAEQAIQQPALGAVPATPQRIGDPNVGYDALVNQPYFTCGMPFSAYQRNAKPPEPNQTLPGRNDLNRDLPYMLTSHITAENVRLVHSNCLLCHAAFFNDQLIIGLGNEFLDFTEDPSINAEQLGAYIDEDSEAREWKKWADRIAAISPYIQTDTVGVNPAVNMTFALIAHRDPLTLRWSEEPLIEPPPNKPLPVSVPPWWRLKKKNALFYSTEGRGDHARIMMLGETLCTDSIEEARRIDRLAPDIRAFLTTLEAPEYPFSVNSDRAAKGRVLFEQNCSRCHGTYDDRPSYPNLVFGYTEIGTDPELAKFFTAPENARFIRWASQSFYFENSSSGAAPGYIAPPLDGIWATAPFFHNGSVPTIAGVLDSASRPQFWLYPEKPSEFDQDTLGWRHQVLDYGKHAARNHREWKRLYDTTAKGYSNAGHTYGDQLSPAQRRTLIEYLKTL